MDGGHDSDERRLSSECGQNTTEFTRCGHIQQILHVNIVCASESVNVYLYTYRMCLNSQLRWLIFYEK